MLKVKILLVLVVISYGKIKCQNFSQKTTSDNDTTNAKQYKPEIFTNGFIDVMGNGQASAAARLIRLYIGEPNKFAIPLSLYGGFLQTIFKAKHYSMGSRVMSI